VAVPTPLAKPTLIVLAPVTPLELAKKPVPAELLSPSVIPPLGAVALFPNWSNSCKLSVTFVVLLADAEDGLGVTLTFDAAAAVLVSEKLALPVTPVALAAML
jgi:hypothetical protein